MSTDFSANAKHARSQIPVPDVPMREILARSAEIRSKSKLRAIVMSCAISLAMIGTAAALGTNVLSGVRLWLTGNTGAIVIQSFAMVRDPRDGDLESVLSNATFPVVLPVALPAGVHVRNLIYSPAAHPTIVSIDYEGDQTNWHAGFTLVDTAAIRSGVPPIPGVRINADRWSVGRETVLLPHDVLVPHDLARIKAAMLSSSASASLNATRPLLYRAMVLGAARDLGRIARQYAPSAGRTVVLGRFFVSAIPSLAARGKPLIGSNTTYLTNIPNSGGEPDYAKATLRWPHTIALSAAGTRAVAAVLRHAHGATTHCNCALVVNTQDGTHYRVWEIGSNGVVTVYRVNAETLNVDAARR